jgi:YfiH family protein
MPFRQHESLRFYQFETLAFPSVIHAIFTRHGGVSPDPWRSLNVGGTVGDDDGRVVENRRRSFRAFNRDIDSIYDVWQVHSAEVVQAVAPRGERSPIQADAIITDNPEVTLFMRFADCVPVMLYDPNRQAIGLVHAGWMGTVRHALLAAVEAMVEAYQCNPRDLVAGIGPSIGPDHYAVGSDVVSLVETAFGAGADQHLQIRDGRTHFDLWSANKDILESCGVRSIEVAGVCTACHVEDWYSHRRERGVTGRFGGLIALRA